MITNRGLRFLCSLPLVLFFLYFIPFIGVCLLLMRLFIYREKRKTAYIIVAIGVILLIPSILESILNIVKFDIKAIPLLYDLVYLDIYNKDLISYAKFLITIGIIFMLLSYIVRTVTNRVGNTIRDYIRSQENIDREIKEKNDLIMQEKREKAKNTHVVRCPYCGADNMLTSKTGKCKFCRRNLQGNDK